MLSALAHSGWHQQYEYLLDNNNIVYELFSDINECEEYIDSEKFDYLKKKYAAKADIAKFKDYGMLSGNTLDDLKDETKNHIIFLDELNRQTKDQIRGSLLTLINNKTIAITIKTIHIIWNHPQGLGVSIWACNAYNIFSKKFILLTKIIP